MFDAITFIKEIEGGRWEIDKDNDQMIFYKSDNITVLATFSLHDENGFLTTANIFERRRI